MRSPSSPAAQPPAGATPGAAPRNVSVVEALQLAAQHFQAGNRGEVENICLKVLEVEPENPEALHLIGVLAHLAGKQAIALALIEKAVRLSPRNAQYHYNLGVVLGVIRRGPEALAAYRAAIAIDPLQPNALGNLGNIALELDLFDEALAAYEAILARQPGDANVALARAITLYSMRRFDQAGPAFEVALGLEPQGARQHWERAHYLLMTGQLPAGWEDYEYRFSAPQSNVWHYPYPFPRWQGEPLAGKTLLLHGEQGLGDEIMFGSIYPELIAEAGAVIICCQPHLSTLFRDSFAGARVIEQLRAESDAWTRRPADWLASAPHIDYQVPFGSLGRLRRRSLADFHRHAGYLRADAAKQAAWAQNLAAHFKPSAGPQRELRIGLCWAANPAIEDAMAARRSRKKSLTLAQLEPLLAAPRAQFVSLQTWEAAAQVSAASAWTRERVYDASAGLKDFSDTAALIMNLDLVITVDTSVAHLAGALGKPVWVLLPWQGDWRWHGEGAGTEWYPSALLYRQPALGDWESVMQQVSRDLAALPRSGAQGELSPPAPAGAAAVHPAVSAPVAPSVPASAIASGPAAAPAPTSSAPTPPAATPPAAMPPAKVSA